MVSGTAGVAVVEEGGIALHESNGELLEEVGDGDRLVLPRVPGKCAAQFLDLGNGSLVPATKALHCNRQENNALVTVILCSSQSETTHGYGEFGLLPREIGDWTPADPGQGLPGDHFKLILFWVLSSPQDIV